MCGCVQGEVLFVPLVSCWNEATSTDHYLLYKPLPSLQTTDCLNSLADAYPDEILCTKSEVTELLMTLDIAKASGLDGISARMLRSCGAYLPSLTTIFKKIYSSRLEHFLHPGKSQALFQ